MREPETAPGLPAIAALLASMALFVLGNGLQNTLVSIRAAQEGMAVETIGLMTTSYFAGYVSATVAIHRIVLSVGHIRSFAGFAAIASVSPLLHALWVSPAGWCIIRALSGASYAGMIVVVESWLNGSARRESRGRTLAVYSIALTGSWMFSQQLLNVAAPSGATLFLLASMCLSLSLVPITLIRSVEPGIIPAPSFGLRRLFARAPIGLAGSFVSGLCVSAFIGLGPVFARDLHPDTAGVSLFMSTTIVGALFVHWPLGRLSDRMDRRRLMVLSSGTAALVSFLLAWDAATALVPPAVLAFLFGGTAFSFYALAVAHVHDLVEDAEMVPAASLLIFVYGIGSICGGLLSGLMMGLLGPGGLFVLTGAVKALFVIYGLLWLPRVVPIPARVKKAFVAMPRTSHVVLEMLARPRHLGRRRREGD